MHRLGGKIGGVWYTVVETASERRRGEMSEADPKLEHFNHRLMNCEGAR